MKGATGGLSDCRSRPHHHCLQEEAAVLSIPFSITGSIHANALDANMEFTFIWGKPAMDRHWARSLERPKYRPRPLPSSINEPYPGLGTTEGAEELRNSSCPGEASLSLEPEHKGHMREIKI